MFGMLRRTFQHLDATLFVPLYKSIVRTHLEFASSVWAPFQIKHIVLIEKVQRRATKQLPGFKELPYPERLQKLKLPTLAYRRIRGDMIEMYKIVNNVYDSQVCNFINLWSTVLPNKANTRGNSLKVYPQHSNF